MNICVCDDDMEFVRVFVNLISFWCESCLPKGVEYNICETFNRALDVIDHLRETKIDVLFLDIDMPEMNGFDLAKRVEEIDSDVMIVFVSGYDHYVFEVFEFFPFAYLRKSKISEELPRVLHRIGDRIVQRDIKMNVYTVEGQLSVAVNDVLYIMSEGNYNIIKRCHGDTLMCRGTLSGIEKKWSEYGFYRVHAAYIVNMDQIQSVRNNALTIGEDKEVIPISQRRLASFRKAYAAFTIRRLDV